jgi:hypothetical protein
MWMNTLFLGVAALLAAGALSGCWHGRWMRRLPGLGDDSPAAPAEPTRTRCSVIVAARDEEARIEQTVRRLLAQRDVELEVIVVDDRSTDRTGAILAALAREDSRVRPQRVDVLPEGWLGKCHACHRGAMAATGDWLLFTDADCWSRPDVLRRALAAAQQAGVEHVTLSSGLAVSGPGLRAGSLLFHLSLANWFSGVNRDRPKAHVGFGAFNLVRASAYRACGGYEALRLTVLDDVKLGLLIRRAGFRTRAFLGGSDVEALWGTRLWDSVRLMEKNYFAALEFSLPLALGVCGFLCFLMGTAVMGAIVGTPAGWVAAVSPWFLAIPGAILSRRLGWPWWQALGMPLALPVFVSALVHSTYRTLSRGGVRWRETFYPLAVLRAGRVR